MLGHADISTTPDVYADVTKDLKRAEMQLLNDFMSSKKVVILFTHNIHPVYAHF